MTIGDVRSSAQIVGGVNATIRPDGNGVASALSALSQNLGQTALTNEAGLTAEARLTSARKAREDRVIASKLQAQFIELDSSLSREMADRHVEASNEDVALTGFTDSTEAWARTSYEEFKSKIPADLRPTFEAQIESALQNKITSAFGLQTGAENAQFVRDVTGLVDTARETILSTPITSEAELDALEVRFIEQAELLLKNSPLTGDETQAQVDFVIEQISQTKMLRAVREEQLDTIAATGSMPGGIRKVGNRDVAKNPVALGLSPAAVGFLNAIAGPESAGAYNILFSPDGERTFHDYADHPRNPARIEHGPHQGDVSSAAGRYQFISGTWDRVARELGLTDFSPENQDRAAWHLAQADYFERTGRDLTSVLASGDQAAIITAKRVLTATWEGLGNMPDEDFVDAIAQQNGTPSSMMFSEEYAHIPLERRMAIMQQGLQESAALRAEMVAQTERDRNQRYTALLEQIHSGSGNPSHIEDLHRDVGLSLNQRDEAMTLYEEKNQAIISANRVLENINNQAYLFDPTNTDTKEDIDSFYEQMNAGQHLLEQDGEFVSEFFLPMTERTNYVPESMSNRLSQMISARDPSTAKFALDTLTALSNQSPNVFSRAFPKAVVEQVALYKHGSAVLGQEELLQSIQQLTDPAFEQQQKIANTIVQQSIKDSPEIFAPLDIARRLGADKGIDPINGPQLAGEFGVLFRKFIGKNLNERQAMKAADEVLSQRWGAFELGGQTSVMLYPPNKEYPTFENSHDYIEQQLVQDLGLDAADGLGIISDPRTDKERNSGVAPSYAVTRTDLNGVVQVLRNFELPGFDALDPQTQREIGNLPARFTPVISDEMRLTQATRIQSLTEIEAELEKIREEQPTNIDEIRDKEKRRAALARKRQEINFDMKIPEPIDYNSLEYYESLQQ